MGLFFGAAGCGETGGLPPGIAPKKITIPAVNYVMDDAVKKMSSDFADAWPVSTG